MKEADEERNYTSGRNLNLRNKYSRKSQADRKETPTKRPRDPPRSAMKEMVGYAQTSVSTLISVEAKP